MCLLLHNAEILREQAKALHYSLANCVLNMSHPAWVQSDSPAICVGSKRKAAPTELGNLLFPWLFKTHNYFILLQVDVVGTRPSKRSRHRQSTTERGRSIWPPALIPSVISILSMSPSTPLQGVANVKRLPPAVLAVSALTVSPFQWSLPLLQGLPGNSCGLPKPFRRRICMLALQRNIGHLQKPSKNLRSW